MTTTDKPANNLQEALEQADESHLILVTLYYSINELLENPSRFDAPQELLVDLLGKYHDVHAALAQFQLLARIYANFDLFTKQQLQIELYAAAKTVGKLRSEWRNLVEVTTAPQTTTPQGTTPDAPQ